MQIWIDGVGSVRFLFGDDILIGGPSSAEDRTDAIRLQANLSREHARIVRREGGYLLHARGDCCIDETRIRAVGLLYAEGEIRLGSDVKLRFRQPSPLTETATLECISGHQAGEADRHVLMESSCLIGPGPTNHLITPRDFPSLVLFRKGNGLACRADSEIITEAAGDVRHNVLSPNTTYEIGDYRFRWEASHTHEAKP